VNVGFSAFHEGRGAGKSTTTGVEKRMLIFENRIFGKNSWRKRNSYEKKIVRE
jgi:hypothetical protein